MKTTSINIGIALLLTLHLDIYGGTLIFTGSDETDLKEGYCSMPLGSGRDSLSTSEDFIVEYTVEKIITGVVTKGSSRTTSRVTHFKVSYSTDCVHFEYIRSADSYLKQDSNQYPPDEPLIFATNIEPNTTTTTVFDHVFPARCVQVVPYNAIGKELTISFDFIGCDSDQCQADVVIDDVTRGDNKQHFRFPVEKVFTEISINVPLNPSNRYPDFEIAYSRTCNFDLGPSRFLLNDDRQKIFSLDDKSGNLVINRSESPVRAQCVAINRIDRSVSIYHRTRGNIKGEFVPIQDAAGFDVTFKGCDALEPHETVSASCGKSRIKTDNKHGKRVVGGSPSVPGQWPWLVSLHYLKYHKFLKHTGLRHLCTASLIHPQWALTAAHCVHKRSGTGLDDKDNWLMMLGEHQQNQHDGVEQVVGVEKIITHSNYTDKLGDIALLKLSSPAMMSDYVNTICIEPNFTFPGFTSCVTAGWGNIGGGSKGGVELPNHANVQLLSQSECRRRYNSLPHIKTLITIDESVLCAAENGKDSCYGDSGGPLICKHGGHWVQVGIVSYGFGCGDARYPGIYTNVNHYYDWIQDVISSN